MTLQHNTINSAQFQIALYLPQVTFKQLPLIVMGGATMVGGVLTLLLMPETMGMPLPQTISDVEKLRHNQKRIWQCATRTNNLSNKSLESDKQPV